MKGVNIIIVIISVILIALWFLLIRVLRILLDADDCIFRFKSIIRCFMILNVVFIYLFLEKISNKIIF
jgi:hypothetical protein